VRGYGWLGQKGLTLWDEGAQTKKERDLGFQSFDWQSRMVERAQDTKVMRPDDSTSAPTATA